jgi:PHD/YefM family antitoxin component YafN of YafNO toxin-antitoxin module
MYDGSVTITYINAHFCNVSMGKSTKIRGIMHETLDISEARKKLSTIAERLHDERVIFVTRHSRKAFAVVDLDYLEAVMETMEILSDPETLQMLSKSIQDVKAGRVHDHDDVVKELG